MSQESNSNIDEILEQIKKWPEDMGQDSWNGIPSDGISIYKDIILALEENDIDNLLSASEQLDISVDAYRHSNIVKLDVDIVMKLTEQLLERAKDVVVDNGVVYTDFIGGMQYLFMSLDDVIDLYRRQKEAKITGQDIEKCISLADKVFASSNNIKINVSILDSIFSILNNAIYHCNEEIKSESVSKVIEFVETVEKDKRIQWNDVTVCSVLWALRSISERSEFLSPDQAAKIFNMTNAFVDKIDNFDTFDSTDVCAMLINPLKDMLCEKNNPAKIDVKQCLDLVKQILNKSDAIDDLRLIEAVIDIINHYGKDKENDKDIQEYGFYVGSEEGNGRMICAIDPNKLEKFLPKWIFDSFRKYLKDRINVIEVVDTVVEKPYMAKVNVNVQLDNQNLSKVQKNTGEHKSNLNDDQNKNDDVIEHEYSSTTNVDMPTNNQNSPKVPPEISDDKDNARSEKKQSMSFNRSQSAFKSLNNMKVIVWPKAQEDLLNSKPSKMTDTKQQNKKVLSVENVIYNGRNDPNKKVGFKVTRNVPIDYFDQIQDDTLSAVTPGVDSTNIDNSNLIKISMGVKSTVSDKNQINGEPVKDKIISNSGQLEAGNNHPVQTGDYNNIQINPEVSKNNKGNETQKHEAEYKPTKTFVILAVLSLFVPFIPGLIFVIADNKKKESPLIKVLVFIPVVSPIILGIKTYKAYQANKVLEAKKALAKAEPSLELYSKTNNFQNIHDMQKRKSEINGEKDESEKSNSTKGISDVNANDTK